LSKDEAKQLIRAAAVAYGRMEESELEQSLLDVDAEFRSGRVQIERLIRQVWSEAIERSNVRAVVKRAMLHTLWHEIALIEAEIRD
jgi:hypothetical protein